MDTRPHIFKVITLHYIIRGLLSAAQLQRILHLSHKYCPVLHSLNPAIEIKSTYELQNSSK